MAEADAQHDAAVTAEHATDDGAIGGTGARPEQRLDDAAALHLVVVLSDDPFLAGHVGRREHVEQAGGERVVGAERPRSRFHSRWHVARRKPPPRPALVEEVAVEFTGRPALPAEQESARTGEGADGRGLHPLVGRDLGELLPVGGRDGEHHPLLCLRDPGLGGGEAVILQRHAVEVDLRTERGGHLAHGAREPAGAAVGDGGEEPLPRRLQHEVDEHLLVDGVTDLHRTARLALAVTRQFDARKGGAVDAVAAGPPAGHDHQIAHLHGGVGRVARHDAHRAAEDQRVADVARIVGDGAGDRGDAHAVAVVANPSHDTRQQPAGMNHARRQVGGGGVGPADAEDVEVGDRLGAEACAEHVADHATEPGGRAAVGLDRRGMIVRFNLHADVVVAIESHHARVVAEHAHAPIVGAELLPHLPRGCKHRLLEEIVIPHGA